MGPTRKLSALVVDDEPSLVRVVEGYLSKDGFDVRTAGDAETAVAVARESEPDLVVLDLGLPGIYPCGHRRPLPDPRSPRHLLDNALRHTTTGGTVAAPRRR